MRIRKELGAHNIMEVLHILYSKNVTLDQNYLQLTPRGREVFSLIIKGKTDSVISHQLGISKSAVRRHKEKMILSNDCDSMLSLVTKYYRTHIE